MWRSETDKSQEINLTNNGKELMLESWAAQQAGHPDGRTGLIGRRTLSSGKIGNMKGEDEDESVGHITTNSNDLEQTQKQ